MWRIGLFCSRVRVLSYKQGDQSQTQTLTSCVDTGESKLDHLLDIFISQVGGRSLEPFTLFPVSSSVSDVGVADLHQHLYSEHHDFIISSSPSPHPHISSCCSQGLILNLLETKVRTKVCRGGTVYLFSINVLIGPIFHTWPYLVHICVLIFPFL